jgi:hypothetical protein
MKAVRLIRREGLKNRMQEPEGFIRQMNRLSIEMTHTRRQKDGKRARKKVFRSMKKLIRDLINTKIPFIMSSNFKSGGIEDEDIDTDSKRCILTDGGLGCSFG